MSEYSAFYDDVIKKLEAKFESCNRARQAAEDENQGHMNLILSMEKAKEFQDRLNQLMDETTIRVPRELSEDEIKMFIDNPNNQDSLKAVWPKLIKHFEGTK